VNLEQTAALAQDIKGQVRKAVVGQDTAIDLLLLAWFLIGNFYFIAFELRWQGQTPGKRILGLRVVDRRGGALTGSTVAARNLMREIEVFMPLRLLLFPFATATDAWLVLLALAWMSIFTLMPLFNRDRMRVGDMVAGT